VYGDARGPETGCYDHHELYAGVHAEQGGDEGRVFESVK
jgi:hypothetical protein